MRRAVWSAMLLVLIASACGSSQPQPKVVALTAPPRNTYYPRSFIVDALKKDCPTSSGQVQLNFAQGDNRVRHTFDCSTVRNSPTAAEAQLVALVTALHGARARADRIIGIEHALHLSERPYGDLVWGLATTDGGMSCIRADDDRFHRQELSSRGTETPLHWTQVEAAYIAGACRDRLPVFLRSVDNIGLAKVAATVRAQLASITG